MPDSILRRLVDGVFPLLPSVSDRAARPPERVRLGTAGPDCVALGAAALMILAELSPDYEALPKS